MLQAVPLIKFLLSFLRNSYLYGVHTDAEFVEMYSGKNSNADLEYIAGKLRKRNSASNVIRLHFLGFVSVEAVHEHLVCCQS